MTKSVKVPPVRAKSKPLYNGAPRPQPAIRPRGYVPPSGTRRASGKSGDLPPFQLKR